MSPGQSWDLSCLRITYDVPTSLVGTIVRTLTLNPGTGAQRGVICSMLVIQCCCLGANEGYQASSQCFTRKWMKMQMWIFHTPEYSKQKLTELWETSQQWIWESYIYKSCYITGSCNSDRLSCPNSLTLIFSSITLYCGDHSKCIYKETRGQSK